MHVCREGGLEDFCGTLSQFSRQIRGSNRLERIASIRHIEPQRANQDVAVDTTQVSAHRRHIPEGSALKAYARRIGAGLGPVSGESAKNNHNSIDPKRLEPLVSLKMRE